MENHEAENHQPEVAAESSDRRDFLKKMVVAGAFAAPVVATFARGIRGSKSLQAAVEGDRNLWAVRLIADHLVRSGLSVCPPTTRNVAPFSALDQAAMDPSRTM